MKNISNNRGITNHQEGLADMLRSLNPFPRFVLGLVGCAVLAYCVPMLVITFTGVWNNILGMWLVNTIVISVLIVQNLIGNKARRVFLTGVAFAALLDFYALSLIVRTRTLRDWNDWWLQLLIPAIVCLLNAFLFIKYKKVADL